MKVINCCSTSCRRSPGCQSRRAPVGSCRFTVGSEEGRGTSCCRWSGWLPGRHVDKAEKMHGGPREGATGRKQLEAGSLCQCQISWLKFFSRLNLILVSPAWGQRSRSGVLITSHLRPAGPETHGPP